MIAFVQGSGSGYLLFPLFDSVIRTWTGHLFQTRQCHGQARITFPSQFVSFTFFARRLFLTSWLLHFLNIPDSFWLHYRLFSTNFSHCNKNFPSPGFLAFSLLTPHFLTSSSSWFLAHGLFLSRASVFLFFFRSYTPLLISRICSSYQRNLLFPSAELPFTSSHRRNMFFFLTELLSHWFMLD